MPRRRIVLRISIAFAGFALAITLIVGLATVGALKYVESQILSDVLSIELENLRNSVSRREWRPFSRNTTVFVVRPNGTDTPPEFLRAMPAGTHNVLIDGRPMHVLIEDDIDARYIIQYDTTEIRARESQFIKTTLLISIVVFVAAIGVGVLLARRMSAPINRLAEDVLLLERGSSANIDISRYHDDEVGLLAERIHDYHRQLFETLAREREFAANVSHELRTPVTNIGLAAEVLASSRDVSDQTRARIERIQRATREMTELIETFLVLARASDTDEVPQSSVDVNPIVRDVVAQQRIWLRDKPVEVEIVENGTLGVQASARVVSVLIGNLVRNAFRYTNKGHVRITIGADRLVVEDTGPGFGDLPMEKLFMRYEQGAVVDSDGFGLGLAIVKRICDRFGWSVHARGDDTGSRFEVRFAAD